MSIAAKAYLLLKNGFTIGQRDPRVNTKYDGDYMVIEPYTILQLPTEDASNGPWCIVGDSLDSLIIEAFTFFKGLLNE